jgi:hypothetical protein
MNTVRGAEAVSYEEVEVKVTPPVPPYWLSIFFVNDRNKYFGKKMSFNSISKWSYKYSHLLSGFFASQIKKTTMTL